MHPVPIKPPFLKAGLILRSCNYWPTRSALGRAAYAALFRERTVLAICGEETALGDFFAEFKAAFNTRGGGRNGIRQGTVCADRAEIERLFTE